MRGRRWPGLDGDRRLRHEKRSKKEEKRLAEVEKNLQFIANDAKIKESSGLPKRISEPDTTIQHTVDVSLPKIRGVVPKGTSAVDVYTMAGNGTSTPIRDLKRLSRSTQNMVTRAAGKRSLERLSQSIIIMWFTGMKT